MNYSRLKTCLIYILVIFGPSLIVGIVLYIQDIQSGLLSDPGLNITDPAPGEAWTDPITGMVFVWVPGGCFMMGQTASEKEIIIKTAGEKIHTRYFQNEFPRHEVCLDGFWMSKYEVTNRQYRLYDPGHDSKDFEGIDFNSDNQPVVNVSWDEATAFIRWLKEKTGQFFSLPTEAQWEYAARAGTEGMRYWEDDAEGGACRYANVYDSTAETRLLFLLWGSFDCEDGFVGTAPVGSFLPNAFGLHDMLGNVWEWCEDVYDPYAYIRPEGLRNPVITSGGSDRAIRGGGWFICHKGVRVANRSGYDADAGFNALGFRLCIPHKLNRQGTSLEDRKKI